MDFWNFFNLKPFISRLLTNFGQNKQHPKVDTNMELNKGIFFRAGRGNRKFQIINREISWLMFNERVLQEAANTDTPLIERIRFLAIFSSNLDDFYRARVATQRRLALIKKSNLAKQLYFDPNIILKQVQQIVIEQSEHFDEIFNNQIIPELAKEQIFIVNQNEFSQEQSHYLTNLFKTTIFTHLTPIMLKTDCEFPNLQDGAIYLAVEMYYKNNKKDNQFALIQLSNELPRFYILPTLEGKHQLVLLDDLIRHNLKTLFSFFDYDCHDAYTIKLTRDSELDIENDIPASLMEKLNHSLKKRKKGVPVRFVYDETISEKFLKFLIKNIKLEQESLIPGGRYHQFSDFRHFPDLGKKHLLYEPFVPLTHPQLEGKSRIVDVLAKQDILLHHPYQSFDYLIRFLREAAIDPNVTTIRITLYRVAKISVVCKALITAVANGKKVIVIIELRARFDEQSNINWANRLQEVGVKVIYGVPNMKVHSKFCIVTRKEKGRLKQYAHFSTGNYNGITAKIYCDDALMTADKRLTDDAEQLFDAMLNENQPYTYKHLLVAPLFLRAGFEALIEKEITNAKRKKQAYIILKMNSLTDERMIEKLYDASRAGVKITLIVRGMCCLIPNIPSMSENIKVISIVDRFLEHSRVYVFCNGGKKIVYLCSADFMNRNLSDRIEMGIPIYDQQLKKEMMDMLNFQIEDNVKARNMKNPLENTLPILKPNQTPIRSQHAIYEYLKQKANHEQT